MLEQTGALGRMPTLAAKIVQEFLRLVETGAVRPGDRLPAETELAEAWGVGRSSVREALRVFQLLGVIAARPGRGTVLIHTAPLFLIMDWSRYTRANAAAEIGEARLVLETGLVRLAAERATAADLAQMAGALARGQGAGGDPEASIESSLDFHTAIAAATHNQTLLLINRLLRGLYHESTRQARRDPHSYAALQRDHEAILAAIRAGDPDRAAAVMAAHLGHGIQFILAGAGKKRPRPAP